MICPPLGFVAYLTSGHFISAVFENWESEFLQMAAYVLLTVFLFQKGVSESKKPDEHNPEDEPPSRASQRSGCALARPPGRLAAEALLALAQHCAGDALSRCPSGCTWPGARVG